MATGSTKDEPTVDQRVKHNIAPEPVKTVAKPDPLDHDQNGKKGGAKKAEQPDTETLAERNQRLFEEEQQKQEAEIKASRKGTAVDGLNLPEKQGEVLWQTSIEIGAREQGEKDNDWHKRWEDGENAVVATALSVMAGPGGIRPNGYQLVKDENAGILRLILVSADPGHPDPKLVGGLPNADGKY